MARRKVNLAGSMTASSKAPAGLKQKRGGVTSYPAPRKTARPGKMMREVGPAGMRH